MISGITRMTLSMTGYKPGDILLIPFPFTDLTDAKQRPAVVLSSSRFNRMHHDVIIAAITSRVPRTLGDDEYLLSKDEQKSAGLPKPSLVKVGKIVALDQTLTKKRLGRLSADTIENLTAILFAIFNA